mgnify:FL=1
MSNLDLVLKGGTVFLPDGRTTTDIGIKDGKISTIGACDNA